MLGIDLRVPDRTAVNKILSISAVAVIYYALARAGLLIALIPANASPMWPAAGFALAAVLLWGPQAGLGVFVGAWLANDRQFLADHSAPPVAALIAAACIGLGNAAEAMLGALLLRRIGHTEELSRRTREAVLFCVLAPVVGAISPCIGPLTLVLRGILPWARFTEAALTWWIGDTIGILVVTPLMLAWCAPRVDLAIPSSSRTAETFAAAALLGISSWLGFSGQALPYAPNAPLSFITLPAAVLDSLSFRPTRFDPRRCGACPISDMADGSRRRFLHRSHRPEFHIALIIVSCGAIFDSHVDTISA